MAIHSLVRCSSNGLIEKDPLASESSGNLAVDLLGVADVAQPRRTTHSSVVGLKEGSSGVDHQSTIVCN